MTNDFGTSFNQNLHKHDRGCTDDSLETLSRVSGLDCSCGEDGNRCLRKEGIIKSRLFIRAFAVIAGAPFRALRLMAGMFTMTLCCLKLRIRN